MVCVADDCRNAFCGGSGPCSLRGASGRLRWIFIALLVLLSLTERQIPAGHTSPLASSVSSLFYPTTHQELLEGGRKKNGMSLKANWSFVYIWYIYKKTHSPHVQKCLNSFLFFYSVLCKPLKELWRAEQLKKKHQRPFFREKKRLLMGSRLCPTLVVVEH